MLPLALTLWDHAINAVVFILTDLAIAYAFVAHIGPRLNGNRVEALLATQRTLLLEEVGKLFDAMATRLQPSPEDQDAARAALADVFKTAAGEAVAAAIPAGIAAHSSAGVDARTTFKAQEEEFLAAVAQDPKGGVLVAAAVEHLKGLSPAVYKLAVRAGPDHVPEFLERNKGRLDKLLAKIGLGDDTGASSGLTLV